MEKTIRLTISKGTDCEKCPLTDKCSYNSICDIFGIADDEVITSYKVKND